MNGLAMGLLQGATGLLKGRQIAQDRATDDQRYQDQQARIKRQEDAQREAAFQEAADRLAQRCIQQAALTRQREMDAQRDFESGYRPAADSEQFAEARAALGVPDAKPAFTSGGVPMLKTAESLGEKAARMAVEQEAKRTADNRAFDLQRDAQNNTQADRRLRMQLNAQQPRQPDLVPGGDGNMYRFDPRTQSMVAVPVRGLPQMIAERAVAQQVPTQRPVPSPSTSLDTVPGAGFSRGFQSPQAPPQPQEQAPPQQQPRGPFGKAMTSGVTPAQQKEFTDAETATRQLNGLLDQYRAAVAKQGTALWDGNNPDRAAMSSLQRQITTLYKGPAFANLGVLTGPDLEILNQIISPATGMGAKVRGTDAILRQIDQLKGNVEGARKIRHEVIGVPYQPLATTAPGASLDAIMGGRP